MPVAMVSYKRYLGGTARVDSRQDKTVRHAGNTGGGWKYVHVKGECEYLWVLCIGGEECEGWRLSHTPRTTARTQHRRRASRTEEDVDRGRTLRSTAHVGDTGTGVLTWSRPSGHHPYRFGRWRRHLDESSR